MGNVTLYRSNFNLESHSDLDVILLHLPAGTPTLAPSPLTAVSLPRRTRTDAPDSRRIDGARCLVGLDPTILGRIAEPGVDLTIWNRPLPPALSGPLARSTLRTSTLPALRTTVPTVAPEATLAAALRDLKDRRLADALADDVGQLVRLVAPLIGRETLSVRLEAVTGDACRRFHADRIPLRLIVTYRGPGTEWVDEAVLPPGGDPRHPPMEAVRRVPAGAVALFKGSLGSDRPLLHRSPPIAGTGAVRLLLCIDEGLPAPASPSGDTP